MPTLAKNRHTFVYTVAYTLYQNNAVHYIDVISTDKWSAYDRAVYEVIPAIEGKPPYSAWVESVTFRNGSQKRFNTFEGKPV